MRATSTEDTTTTLEMVSLFLRPSQASSKFYGASGRLVKIVATKAPNIMKIAPNIMVFEPNVMEIAPNIMVLEPSIMIYEPNIMSFALHKIKRALSTDRSTEYNEIHTIYKGLISQLLKLSIYCDDLHLLKIPYIIGKSTIRPS